MDWRQIAAMWLLAVTIGGLTITGIILYITRDTGRRASGVRRWPLDDEAILARWRRSASAASERTEARRGQLGPVPPGRQSTTLACAGVGHRLCDGRQQIAPGETRPCSCQCHRDPGERVGAYYRAVEERLTQQLLDAGAARWR